MDSERLYKMLYYILADYPGVMGGSLLGTYLTDSGDELPAIWQGEPPNTHKCGGLECIVPLMSDGPTVWQGHSVYTRETWDVILTEHSDDSTYIQMAAKRLRRFFPNSSTVHTLATEISLPQLRFSIYHESRLNAVTFGVNKSIFSVIK